MAFSRLIAAPLIASSLLLSACGETEEAPAEFDGIAGLEISNARMVLGAVEGNPAAVYFDASYSGDRAFSIRTADVAGAKSSVMHTYGEWNREVQMMDAGLIPVKNGTEVSFKPGDLHIMAMEPSPELKPGGKTEVTIIISGGDKHSFEAEILAAGDER
ncbi:MAG: copper chaperone PCu(A)C [Erythrobacter sp.]